MGHVLFNCGECGPFILRWVTQPYPCIPPRKAAAGDFRLTRSCFDGGWWVCCADDGDLSGGLVVLHRSLHAFSEEPDQHLY